MVDINLMYNAYKIYGPYICKDRRRRIVLYLNGITTTISYAKYLMECHLRKYLESNEEVHHKDQNSLNDCIENYEVKTEIEHRKLHKKELFELFICLNCDKLFELTGTRLKDCKLNRLKGKLGPFCSRSCASKFCCGYRK